MPSAVLKLMNPTIGGRIPVKVGRSTFGFPPGCAVAHSRLHGATITYVLESVGGYVHAFVEQGEVGPLPDALQQLIRQRVFGETPD